MQSVAYHAAVAVADQGVDLQLRHSDDRPDPLGQPVDPRRRTPDPADPAATPSHAKPRQVSHQSPVIRRHQVAVARLVDMVWGCCCPGLLLCVVPFCLCSWYHACDCLPCERRESGLGAACGYGKILDQAGHTGGAEQRGAPALCLVAPRSCSRSAATAASACPAARPNGEMMRETPRISVCCTRCRAEGRARFGGNGGGGGGSSYRRSCNACRAAAIGCNAYSRPSHRSSAAAWLSPWTVSVVWRSSSCAESRET